jgi:hypothetical protein
MLKERLKWMAVILILLIGTSCVGESSYQSDSGTLKIPWGEKEGTRMAE